MDELTLKIPFSTELTAYLARKLLEKKVGCIADVQFENIDVTIRDGKVHAHLDVDLNMEKEELLKLIKKIRF